MEGVYGGGEGNICKTFYDKDKIFKTRKIKKPNRILLPPLSKSQSMETQGKRIREPTLSNVVYWDATIHGHVERDVRVERT